MPIKSRWTEAVPNFRKAFFDADRPDTHYLTFSDYRLLAKQIAVGLQAAGLKPGDRVLLFSGNNLFFPALFLGILMAGGIFTGANPGFVSRELAHQLKDSGAIYMIAAEGSLDVALDAAKQVSMPTSNVFVFDSTIPGSSKPEKSARGGTRHWMELVAPKQQAEVFEWAEPVDTRTTTCCLNYSSGTTGVPKGVEITHYNYVANGSGVVKVSSFEEDHEASVARSVGLCFLPLYHAYAQTTYIANFAKQGIPVYIMSGFDFVKMLTYIQRYRVTQLVSVPPILVALTKHPITAKFDLSSLESVGSGAAPLPPDVARQTERLLKKEDLIVRQGWGMTEVTCTAMAWDPLRLVRSASVGELMPNCAAKVMDEAGREITTPKVPGELWVSGPTVMIGYWRNTKATEETIITDSDGTRWLRTGDVAYFDRYEAGALFFIIDRMKELIKVKGNQVAPAELEALLLQRADVSDAAVVGVTIGGEEVPRAYIVRSPGSNSDSSETGEEIAKWLEERVSKHKRLRGGVAFTDAIPKNPSGKILRKIIREQAKKEVGDREPTASKLS